MGYADDLVLTAESKHDVLERFVRWRKELELRGLKVNLWSQERVAHKR